MQLLVLLLITFSLPSPPPNPLPSPSPASPSLTNLVNILPLLFSTPFSPSLLSKNQSSPAERAHLKRMASLPDTIGPLSFITSTVSAINNDAYAEPLHFGATTKDKKALEVSLTRLFVVRLFVYSAALKLDRYIFRRCFLHVR